MNTKKINSYIVSILQPIIIGALLNVMFEFETYFAYTFALIGYFLYLCYTYFAKYSSNAYEPIINEMESNYEKLQNEYNELQNDTEGYIRLTDNELAIKNEGIASLMVQVKELQTANEVLTKQVKTYQSGEVVQNLKWEVDNTKQTSEKIIQSLQKELATIKETSEKQITLLNNEVGELKDSLKRYISALDGAKNDIELYKPAYIAKEATMLKQKYSALVRTSNDSDKIKEVESRMIELGIEF